MANGWPYEKYESALTKVHSAFCAAATDRNRQQMEE